MWETGRKKRFIKYIYTCIIIDYILGLQDKHIEAVFYVYLKFLFTLEGTGFHWHKRSNLYDTNIFGGDF